MLCTGLGSVRKFDVLMNGQLPECYIVSLVFITSVSISYKVCLLNSSGWKAITLFSEHLALVCFRMRLI